MRLMDFQVCWLIVTTDSTETHFCQLKYRTKKNPHILLERMKGEEVHKQSKMEASSMITKYILHKSCTDITPCLCPTLLSLPFTLINSQKADTVPDHFSECLSTFSKTGHQEFVISTIKELVMTRTPSVYASVQELSQQCTGPWNQSYSSTHLESKFLHKLTEFHIISFKSLWEEDEFREKERKIVKSNLYSEV